MKTKEVTLQGDGEVYIATPVGVIRITRNRGDRRKLIIDLPDQLNVVKDPSRIKRPSPVTLKVV